MNSSHRDKAKIRALSGNRAPANGTSVASLVSAVLVSWCGLSGTLSAAQASDPDDFAEKIRLEAHGFVSFGYFRTWGNNYLAADSMDGSTDLYEAALNASMRPWDRVRLGGQLYLRDLGRYENGEPRLDWAFAEYTLHQSAVIQAGRVKVPVGLYNDLQDNDPARTPVFLPQTIYPIRLRDGQISVDGGKISGFIDDVAGEGVSYAVYGGTKNIDKDSAFAQSSAERVQGTVTDVDVDAFYGGMLNWHTPIAGLSARVSGVITENVAIISQTPFGQVSQYSDVDVLVFSLEWQKANWTIASEYAYSRNTGYVLTSLGRTNVERDYHAGYVSTTWHAESWLDLYGAIEYYNSDTNGNKNDGWSYVAAINVMPLSHWSFKAELQLHDGPMGIQSADNPQGISSSYQVFALKTTVDF